MSAAKHTPGPWALRGYQIRADNGHGAHVATYQISEADGKLLAQAPVLADALEAVLLFHSGGPWDVAKADRYENLTRGAAATSRDLCDLIRARLMDAGRLQ